MTGDPPALRPPDAIHVPLGSSTGELRVRGSRFVCVASPAESESAAHEARDAERTRYHDATHHVWAYRSRTGERRWDDDGEPAGTGGRPVLAAIDSAGVWSVVVVVTRWFGGTRLGTGGLARAYGGAAAAALEAIDLILVRPGRTIRIRYDWPDTGAVARTVDTFGARRTAERHERGPELDVVIPEAESGALLVALKEATAGRATASVGDEQVWVRCQP